MAEYLEVDREKIEVISHGLKPEGHGLPTHCDLRGK